VTVLIKSINVSMPK